MTGPQSGLPAQGGGLYMVTPVRAAATRAADGWARTGFVWRRRAKLGYAALAPMATGAMLKGIRADRPRIPIGGDARMLEHIQRLLPGSHSSLLEKLPDQNDWGRFPVRHDRPAVQPHGPVFFAGTLLGAD